MEAATRTELTAEVARLSLVVDALQAKSVELNTALCAADPAGVDADVVAAMFEGVRARHASAWADLQALRAEQRDESDL